LLDGFVQAVSYLGRNQRYYRRTWKWSILKRVRIFFKDVWIWPKEDDIFAFSWREKNNPKSNIQHNIFKFFNNLELTYKEMF